MAFKVEKISGVRGEVEIGNQKYTFTAYPATLEVTKLLIEAQKKEDQLLFMEAMQKYFDECIEFDRSLLKNVKEEVKRELERSGQFIEFVNYAMEEVGKQTQSAQKE